MLHVHEHAGLSDRGGPIVGAGLPRLLQVFLHLLVSLATLAHRLCFLAVRRGTRGRLCFGLGLLA